MPACIFCEIISRRMSAPVVFEDDDTFVILDHRPLFHGHCLVMPRRHIETLVDLPPEMLAPLFARVRSVTIAVEDAMDASGSFVAINNRVSQSVPHLHVHVVPRRPKDGLKGFFWPRARYSDDAQVETVRSRIRNSIDRLKESLAP